MGWVSGIAVFLITWWTVIFMVLPFGLKRDETGKPENPRLGLKILITTGVSIVIWLAIYALIKADVISFYDMANELVVEDRQ